MTAVNRSKDHLLGTLTTIGAIAIFASCITGLITLALETGALMRGGEVAAALLAKTDATWRKWTVFLGCMCILVELVKAYVIGYHPARLGEGQNRIKFVVGVGDANEAATVFEGRLGIGTKVITNAILEIQADLDYQHRAQDMWLKLLHDADVGDVSIKSVEIVGS